MWSVGHRTTAPVVARYQVELPDSQRVSNTQWSPLAVSPDGSTLVYVGESRRLVVRSREKLELTELAGTEGAFKPLFSRDGRKVGYMSGMPGSLEIRVVPVTGGPPTIVTSTGVGGRGAGWGYDGYIFFDASGVGPLKRVRETGGPIESVQKDGATVDTCSRCSRYYSSIRVRLQITQNAAISRSGMAIHCSSGDSPIPKTCGIRTS